jgi:hypothetical protein
LFTTCMCLWKMVPKVKAPLFPQANQTKLNAKDTTSFSWIVYLILLIALHFVNYHIYCTNLCTRFVDLCILFICIYLQAKPILYAFDGTCIENSCNFIFLIKPIGPSWSFQNYDLFSLHEQIIWCVDDLNVYIVIIKNWHLNLIFLPTYQANQWAHVFIFNPKTKEVFPKVHFNIWAKITTTLISNVFELIHDIFMDMATKT